MHAIRNTAIGVGAAFVAFTGLGFGIEATHHTAPRVVTQDDVKSFNDGFATATNGDYGSPKLMKSARTCTPHTAYVVYGHYLPAHVVKATAKHSAYTILGHYVPARTVKAKSCG